MLLLAPSIQGRLVPVGELSAMSAYSGVQTIPYTGGGGCQLGLTNVR